MQVDIETERLQLRRWCDDDLSPFAAMNADREVMEFFPSRLKSDESDLVAQRIRAHFAEHGFGLWAVEIPGVVKFAGFIGLAIQDFPAQFTPCVDIGWRLARPYWGHGYATEGAKAVLDYGFETLGLDEICSMTAVANQRSERVMRKIGMKRNMAEDFDHPRVAYGHPLARHVLYRAQNPARRCIVASVRKSSRTS